MPIFKFKCRNEKCEHIEREIVKFGVETIKCPKCGTEAYRMIGSFNFQLKGGGWFKDGYTKKEK